MCVRACVCVSFTAKRFGVTEVPMETVTFISHAAQSRLRTIIEKVSTVAQHRLDSCKVTRMKAHTNIQQNLQGKYKVGVGVITLQLLPKQQPLK